MESHDETGCQTTDVPVPCLNNCGFFGTAATMFMCSKCHKDMVLKEEQAKVAASSIGNIMNGSSSSSSSGKDPVVVGNVDVQAGPVEAKAVSAGPSTGSFNFGSTDGKAKDGPNRCTMCRKRVGLTGFHCKCGNLFCPVHRYSDKHDCPFDYRTAAQDALAKANPVVKAKKIDKI